MKKQFVVFFKNWLGDWDEDSIAFTGHTAAAKNRLAKISKTKALNGQATLQEISR